MVAGFCGAPCCHSWRQDGMQVYGSRQLNGISTAQCMSASLLVSHCLRNLNRKLSATAVEALTCCSTFHLCRCWCTHPCEQSGDNPWMAGPPDNQCTPLTENACSANTPSTMTTGHTWGSYDTSCTQVSGCADASPGCAVGYSGGAVRTCPVNATDFVVGGCIGFGGMAWS